MIQDPRLKEIVERCEGHLDAYSASEGAINVALEDALRIATHIPIGSRGDLELDLVNIANAYVGLDAIVAAKDAEIARLRDVGERLANEAEMWVWGSSAASLHECDLGELVLEMRGALSPNTAEEGVHE